MFVIAALLAALALPAGLGAAGNAGAAAGLHGTVMRGPTKPICEEGEPCEKPAVGVVLRFSQYGHVVARVKTREHGRYRVTLAPGRYAVTMSERRVGMGLTPRLVRVRAGRVLRVDFHIDTGIQ